MKGYRTIFFNALAAVVPLIDGLVQVVGAVEGDAQMRSMIPDGWLPYYALAVAVANIWLRTKTDTPAFKKTPDPAAAVVVMTEGEPPTVESISVVVDKTGTAPSAETVLAAVDQEAAK